MQNNPNSGNELGNHPNVSGAGQQPGGSGDQPDDDDENLPLMPDPDDDPSDHGQDDPNNDGNGGRGNGGDGGDDPDPPIPDGVDPELYHIVTNILLKSWPSLFVNEIYKLGVRTAIDLEQLNHELLFTSQLVPGEMEAIVYIATAGRDFRAFTQGFDWRGVSRDEFKHYCRNHLDLRSDPIIQNFVAMRKRFQAAMRGPVPQPQPPAAPAPAPTSYPKVNMPPRSQFVPPGIPATSMGTQANSNHATSSPSPFPPGTSSNLPNRFRNFVGNMFQTPGIHPSNPANTRAAGRQYMAYPGTGGQFGLASPLGGLTSALSTKSTSTKAELFDKGIKKNIDDYIEFKTDKEWRTWNIHTCSMADLHHCSDVLDPSFVPTQPEDIEEFQRKQIFMFNVFNVKIRTDKGRSIILEFADVRDAQAIYKALKYHYEGSTYASINRTAILSSLSNLRLHLCGWRGTYVEFIDFFVEKLREYDHLGHPSQKMSNEFKMSLLQNAVMGTPELHAVKTTSDLEVTLGRPGLDWEQYKSALNHAAAHYDSAHKFRSRLDRIGRDRRITNVHEVHMHDLLGDIDLSPDQGDDDQVYSLDDVREIYRAFRQGKRVFMDKDKWAKLDDKSKALWNQIANDMQAIILNESNDSKTPAAERRVNINEQANTSSDDTAPTTDNDTPYDGDDLLAFLTEQQNKNAASNGTNNSNSQPKSILKNGSTPAAQGKIYTPGDVKQLLAGSHITSPGGVTYEVKAHIFQPLPTPEATDSPIQYSVNLNNRSSRGALVDRGANGGIIGELDAKITAVDPNRHIDITGIDNHQARGLRIVTACALVRSQRGDVICWFHQYAHMPGYDTSIHSSIQLEAYGSTVDEKSKRAGGSQSITTIDGYVFPLDVKNGLPYLKMRIPTDSEVESLPHVHMTSDSPWNPNVYDNDLSTDEHWYDAVEDDDELSKHSSYDETGELRESHSTVATPSEPSTHTPTRIPVNRRYLIHRMSLATSYGEGIQNLCNNDKAEVDAICLDAIEFSETACYLCGRDHHTPFCDTYKGLEQFEAHINTRSQKKLAEASTDRTLTRQDSTKSLESTGSMPGLISREDQVDSDSEDEDEDDDDDIPPPSNRRVPTYRKAKERAKSKLSSKAPKVPVKKKTPRKPPEEIPSSKRIMTPKEMASAMSKDPSLRPDPDDVVEITGGTTMDSRVKDPEPSTLKKYFLFLPTNIIAKTLENTTRFARKLLNPNLRTKKYYRSPNPALNVPRRNESVGTDKVYGNAPAIGFGDVTQAQIFVGLKSRWIDVYPVKSDADFVRVLHDNIRERGAMDKLISDRAQSQIGKKAVETFRTFAIKDGQSEPHHQHQNPTERHWQNAKRNTEVIMNRFGCPPGAWLLALLYVVFIMNRISWEALNYLTPFTILHGYTNDISILLLFWFWQPVYYVIDEHDLSAHAKEGLGRFVGFGETVGHDLTFKILDSHSGQILYRSRVRPRNTEGQEPNLKADSEPNVSKEPEFELKSEFGDTIDGGGKLPEIDTEDLVGRSFLMMPREDGARYRARIVEEIERLDGNTSNDPAYRRFRLKHSHDEQDEIKTYNEILQMMEEDEVSGYDGEPMWNYEEILDHNNKDKTVLIKWSDGSQTWEPRAYFKKDGNTPVLAKYAVDNGLLDTPGWRSLKRYAKTEKKLLRAINQSKLKSFRTGRRFKYGYEIPNSWEDAKRLDEELNSTRWRDAVALEIAQLDEYQVFINLGKGHAPPPGYNKMRGHLVFDVKHDGKAKARYVADGHRTPIPLDSVYSGVVSLRGVRLISFLAELNQLELWGADVGNAYLESVSSERNYIIAGPEFGDREGCVMIVYKALYGQRASGVCWHSRFAAVLKEEGYFPCKAEPDIWMKHCGDHYEYVATYVDDLIIASKDPESLLNKLIEDHKFKLKGTGPITFHLGCDFFRDEDGVLCMQPRKYIDRMCDNYERIFGTKPKQTYTSPLEKGDHPELDDSELCDMEGVKHYQSLIGCLQWCISLGRFDINTAVMTLGSFRAAPRKGHLDRVKRVIGYVSKFRHATIRFRTGEPDYSNLPDSQQDWLESVYGDVREEIPKDIPEPLGKCVVHTCYFDANLYHCMMTGRAVTGILDFVNQTPIDWYSKKQATVETATYGSEFVAGRTAVERTIDLRLTLRYLGVPVKGRTIMFGDNESMIKSSAYPHSTLKKRHNALSFHRVREALASDMLALYHIPGEMNPADILSKHWGYQQIWSIMQPILFWSGDTRRCDSGGSKGSDKSSGLTIPDSQSRGPKTPHHKSGSAHFTQRESFVGVWRALGHQISGSHVSTQC